MSDGYLRGARFWQELDARTRRKTLFDYLSFVKRNNKLSRSDLLEKYAQSVGSSPDRIERLHDLLYFSGLIGIRSPWVTPKVKKILSRGYLISSDYSTAPDWVKKSIDSPPKKLPIRGRFIGSDKSTKNTIYYHPLTRKYFLLDSDGNFVGWVNGINITLTYSLDTSSDSSHQRLILEATGRTMVIKKSPEEIEDIINQLDDFLVDAVAYYFNASVSNIAVKQGIEYQSVPEGSVVVYPSMKVLLIYHHGKASSAKKIEKTKSEFEKDKNEHPDRDHMPRGGRPKKLTEYIK